MNKFTGENLAIETAYLTQLTVTHRARARQALRWRPRFLSALRLSCSFTFAVRAARISYNTFRLHLKNDSEFALQVRDAEEEAADLFHAACFAAAIEGQLEPVYCQGEVVGQIKKFDSRLRIVMLRAHLPDLFRTPGTGKVKVVAGQGLRSLPIGEKELAELVALRQEALTSIAAKEASQRANGLSEKCTLTGK